MIVGMLAGCYLSHERAADLGQEPDAASARDALPADVRACRPSPNEEWLSHCTPAIDATCEERAMNDAFGLIGHSHCVESGDGVHEAIHSYCSLGDFCPDGLNVASCRCTAGRICGGGSEVCVSDTPDGARYCVPICAR